MGLDRTNNDLQQTLGDFTYQSSTPGDTVGDTRFRNISGVQEWSYCAISSTTKGDATAGHWLPYMSIDATGNCTISGTITATGLVSKTNMLSYIIAYGQ
jgi:hypothetical protein